MVMRVFNGVLCALLILFAIVQYNDPDGLFWFAVYGVGAIWCLLAALRSTLLDRAAVRGLFFFTCIAALAGTVWFWPTDEQWWMQEVWWNAETAREGMGMMIILVCLAAAAAVVLRPSRA